MVELVFLIALCLLLTIPFGIATLYFVLSLYQLIAGAKENSRIKQKGGLTGFIVSFIAMAAIVCCWIFRA